MAAKSVGSLFVNLVAKTTGFEKGMKKAQSNLKKFGRSVANIGRKVLTFGTVLTGVSVGGLAIFVRNQLDVIDKLAKTSHALGLTTEALGGLQHAAQITGVSNDQLATGLRRMEKTISDASVGLSTAKRAIGQLGLSYLDLQNLKPEMQFAVIGDALKNVALQSDKARIAQDIFGRSGTTLINTLALGSQGLKDMAKEAKALGLTFTDKQAAQIEKFNDEMTRLKGLIGGLGRRFVIDIAPGASEAIEGLVLLVKQWNNLQGKAGEIRDRAGGWFNRQFNWTGQALGWFSDRSRRIADPLFQGIDTTQGATAQGVNRQFMQPFTREFAERLLRSQERQTTATENMLDAFENDPWVTKALP